MINAIMIDTLLLAESIKVPIKYINIILRRCPLQLANTKYLL